MGPDEPIMTRIGTRWGVPARVEVLSGLFAGQAYERVLLFSSALKAQLEAGPVVGKLVKVTGKNRIGKGWALLEESPA